MRQALDGERSQREAFERDYSMVSPNSVPPPRLTASGFFLVRFKLIDI